MSKKSIGTQGSVWPMPVLIVAAYDEEGKPNLMNAAWGQMCGMDKIALFISEGHKTTQNILKTKAFTVAISDRAHMVEADYVGIASGNEVEDKFARTGLHQTRSEKVNAPLIEEFPLTMECELAEVVNTENMYCIVGKIVDTQVEESAVGEDGKVDPAKLDAIAFDEYQSGYYAMGERVGTAWDAGVPLMK